MNAIDKLIDQARQEEMERRESDEIFAAMSREESFSRCQRLSLLVEKKLGPAWVELKQYLEETYDHNENIHYKITSEKAIELQIEPFEVSCYPGGGGTIEFFNSRLSLPRIKNEGEFAQSLMFLREGFADWNKERLQHIKIDELKIEYEYELIAWKKELEKALEKNAALIAEAQACIPSFVIYELEYVIISYYDDKYYSEIQKVWVQNQNPDNGGYFLTMVKGNIYKKQFFYPVSVSEGWTIKPGPEENQCRMINLPGGEIYYGPGIDIGEYLPELDEIPEIPEPPGELSEWDVRQIKTKVGI